MSNLIRMLTASKSLFSEKRRVFKGGRGPIETPALDFGGNNGDEKQEEKAQAKLNQTVDSMDERSKSEYTERLSQLENQSLEAKQELAETILENSGQGSFEKAKKSYDNDLKSKSDVADFLKNPEQFPVFDSLKDMYPSQQEAFFAKAGELKAYSELQDYLNTNPLSGADITYALMSDKITDGLIKAVLATRSGQGITYENKNGKDRLKWKIPGTTEESSFAVDKGLANKMSTAATSADIEKIFIEHLINLGKDGKLFKGEGYDKRNEMLPALLKKYQEKANVSLAKIKQVVNDFAKQTGEVEADLMKAVMRQEVKEVKNTTLESALLDNQNLKKITTHSSFRLNLSVDESKKISKTGTIEEKRGEMEKAANYELHQFNNVDVYSTADGNLKFYSFTDSRDKSTYVYQDVWGKGHVQIAKIPDGEDFSDAAKAMDMITKDYLKDAEYAMLRPTIKELENMDLSDNIEIEDKASAEKIAEAVDNDEHEWTETFSKLKNGERYAHVLSKLPNVNASDTAKIIHDILAQGPFDDQADFNDFLEAVGGFTDPRTGNIISDADDFQEHFKNLLKTTKGQANLSAVSSKTLDDYTTYYKVGTHILNLLKSEQVIERSKMDSDEALRQKIAGLPTTEELANNFYTLASLSDGKAPTRLDNDTDTIIGLSENVDKQITEIIGDASNNISEGQMLRLLVRTHGLDNLIDTGKVHRNGNKLVIVDLPQEYKNENKRDALKPFIADIAKVDMSSEKRNSHGALEEFTHQDAIKEGRAKLGSLESTETYKGQREALAKALAQASDSETLSSWMANKDSLDAENGYFKALYSPEMIANYITGEEQITLGNGETVQIYKYENGQRRLNTFAIQRTLHYFEHLGEGRAEPNFKEMEATGGYGEVASMEMRSPEKLTKAQAESIIKGFVTHMETQRVKQVEKLKKVEDLFAKLSRQDQYFKQAQDQGYKGDVADFKEDLLFGLGVGLKFDGTDHQATSLGALIPIDENVFLTLSSTNLEDFGIGAGGSVKLFSTKSQEGQALLSGHVTPGTGMSGFAGYMHTFKNENSAWDEHAFAGLSYNLSSDPGVNLILGAGTSYNYEKAVQLEGNKLVDQVDKEKGSAKTVAAIQAIQNLDDKAAAILDHPRFADLKGQVSNETAVALFNVFLAELDHTANTNAEPPLITAFGAGLMMGTDGFGAFVGLKLKIGDKLIYVPKIGEAERMAKTEANIDLNQAIADQQEKPQNYVWRQGGFIIDENGKIVLTDKGRKLETPEGDLQSLKKAFANADIAVEQTELDGKQVLELMVQDADEHTLEVFRDSAATDIGLKMVDNRIYLAGNPQNLVVRRSRLRSPMPDYKGASNVREMIVISTDTNPKSLQDVRSSSAHFLRSVYENGQRKSWEVKEGADPKADVPKWENMESFEDQVAGMDPETYHAAMKVINGSVRPAEGLGKMPSAEEQIQIRESARRLYKSLSEQIKNGNPSIADNEGLAKLITESTAGTNQALTPYHVAIAIQEFQDQYFIKNKADDEKFLKIAEKHNEALKKVFKPKFEDAARRLRLNVYVDKLLVDLIKTHTESLNPKSAGFYLQENTLTSIGTFVRSDKTPALTSLILSPEMAKDEEGTRFLHTYEEAEKNSDLHKIILEVQNPRFDRTDANTAHATLQSPFMQRLINIPHLATDIGIDNFRKLHAFKNANEPNEGLFNDLQAAILDNGESVVNYLNRKSNELRNNSTTTIGGATVNYTAETATALYGKCTNMTLLSKGEMTISSPGSNRVFRAAESANNVMPKLELKRDITTIGLGLVVETQPKKPEKTKTTPDPEHPKSEEGVPDNDAVQNNANPDTTGSAPAAGAAPGRRRPLNPR